MKDPYTITKEDFSFSRIISIIFKSTWLHFKWLFLLFSIFAIGTGILLTAGPKILQQIIDLLITGRGWEPKFWTLLGIYCACLLGGQLCRFCTSKISLYIATQVEDTWRYTGLRHFYDLYLAWHDTRDSGELGGEIERGGSAVYTMLHELMGDRLLVSTVTLLFALSYTLWKFPTFGLMLTLPIPFYIIVTYFISKKIAIGQTHLNKLSKIADRTLYDGVANVRAIKSFGKEKEETQNYAKKWSAYHLYEYGVEKLWFIQDFTQSTIEITLRTLVLAYCVYAVFQGTVTIGEVVLITSYQQMTFFPLQQLNQVFTRIKRQTKKISHLFEIISEEDKLKDTPDAITMKPLQKEIILENVCFHYSKRIAALHDINLRIPASTTTALVGRSGAGKSTIAALLMRFYDINEGKIQYDSIDLRKITRESLRREIAWVPQDTSLFNRSIRDNIAYGKQHATQKEVETAARLADLHDFILTTPKGYDSIIGERGVRISGGQRQRLAIARALLIKPSILILDESTSHLDSETEKAISNSIKRLHHKTTQIIIAHRLSTILHADQIVLLDKGRIIATGKHKELLKNPIYQNLYKLQFHKNE